MGEAFVRLASCVAADSARFHKHHLRASMLATIPRADRKPVVKQNQSAKLHLQSPPVLYPINQPKRIAFTDREVKWIALSATADFGQIGLLQQCQIIEPVAPGSNIISKTNRKTRCIYYRFYCEGVGTHLIVLKFANEEDASTALALAWLISFLRPY